MPYTKSGNITEAFEINGETWCGQRDGMGIDPLQALELDGLFF